MKLEEREDESGHGREVPAGADGEGGAGAGREWTLDRILVIAGFVAMALAVVIIATGDPSLVGPLLVLVLPGIVFTGLLLWQARPWIYLASGIADSLLAVTAMPFGLFGVLANPLAGPLYVSVVLATLALLLALPAGVAGFLRGRRLLPKRSLTEGIHSLHSFAAVAIVAVSVGAMAAGSLAYQRFSTPAPNLGPGYDITASANVSILAENFRFQPDTFNVTAGAVTRITVLNEDDATHTFTYANNGTTYSHDLPPGGATRFFVLFDSPGTVPFWSIPDRDAGMVGNFTLIPP
jgi:plastocyanin